MTIEEQNPRRLQDPADHMANERTFLAWIRTSIGIMAFGFVVEKFSIFLKKLNYFISKTEAAEGIYVPLQPSVTTTTFLGVALVAIGALICLLAFIKYKKIENQINTNTYAPSIILNLMLMLFVVAIGIFLTIFLVHAL